MPGPAQPGQPLTGKGAEHAGSDLEPTVLIPCLAAIDVAPDGDRMRISVLGELDIGGQRLRYDLYEALGRSGSGIDLDLTALEFCDCSGLSILLGLRQRALGQGKTVAIGASSPAVDRLLDVTGTRELFVRAVPDGNDMDAAHTALHGAMPREESDQDLRTEVMHLRRAMQTRPIIDLARGVLMASFSLSAEEAWTVLVTTSQNTNTKVHRLAQDLLSTIEGAMLPEAIQEQLAASVAKANPAPAPPKRLTEQPPPHDRAEAVAPSDHSCVPDATA